MAVTEIFAKACKIEVPTTGLVSDPGDDDDVPGNPVGVSPLLPEFDHLFSCVW